MFSDDNITRRYTTPSYGTLPIDISNTRHSCLQEKFLFPRLLSEDSIPQHIQRLLKGFSKKKCKLIINGTYFLVASTLHICHWKKFGRKLAATLRCLKRDTGLLFRTFQAGYIGLHCVVEMKKILSFWLTSRSLQSSDGQCTNPRGVKVLTFTVFCCTL